MNTMNIQKKKWASITKTVIKGYLYKDTDDITTTIIQL